MCYYRDSFAILVTVTITILILIVLLFNKNLVSVNNTKHREQLI